MVEQLRDLLDRRLAYLRADGEGFFNAERNARVVLAAEQYYRAMYRGSTVSWNLRDRHMFDTLRSLLAHRGAEARAMDWAHNSHIGNAAATDRAGQPLLPCPVGRAVRCLAVAGKHHRRHAAGPTRCVWARRARDLSVRRVSHGRAMTSPGLRSTGRGR
ncbi:Erythromycin esterase [compost metagenome]